MGWASQGGGGGTGGGQGPRGATGEKGEKGDKGDQGLPGVVPDLSALITRIVALELAVANGVPSNPSNPGNTGPTYTGAVGSVAYFILDAGVLATIQVTRDGVDIPGAVSAPGSNSYAYTLVQADDQKPLTVRLSNVTYDAAAPQRYSIEIKDSARDTIEIVYGKTLQLTPINLAHFTLSGISDRTKTLVSAAVVNNVLKLKYSSAFVYGDAPLLTLTRTGSNDFTDYAGNLAPVFTDLAVANNIDRGAMAQKMPVENVLGRDATHGFFAELGGFTCHAFDGNGTDGTDFSYMLVAVATPEGGDYTPDWLYADGWMEAQCQDASPVRRVLGLSQGKDDNQDYKCMYSLTFQGGTLQAGTGHVDGQYAPAPVGPSFTFPSPSASCWMRMGRFGDSLRVDYSTNNKATWTTLHTFAGSDVDPLYGRWGISGRGVPIVGAGLVGFTPEGTVLTT